MMRLFPCVLFLGAIAGPSSGQTTGQTSGPVTGSIRGTVTDAKTHKPVGAALVMAMKTTAPLRRRATKLAGTGTISLRLPASGATGCAYKRATSISIHASGAERRR